MFDFYSGSFQTTIIREEIEGSEMWVVYPSMVFFRVDPKTWRRPEGLRSWLKIDYVEQFLKLDAQLHSFELFAGAIFFQILRI